MKKTNALKITLIISIVILLTLISFAGIYAKRTNHYENIVPSYKLGMDLGSKKVVTIKPNTETKTEIYDENGKKVDSIPEGADESKYTKKVVEINTADSLTEENYQKSKKIIEKRLNAMKAEGYSIRLSKSTGDITVELPDSDSAEKYIGALTATGRFEMVAEDTNELLLSNDDFKNAKVSYYNGDNGTTVYLTIELTKDGAKKLKDISNTYVETVTKNEETGEETKTEKKAILKIDWPTTSGTLAFSEVIKQSFSEEMANGTLQLRVGTASDRDKLQSYYDQAFEISAALNAGKTPVEYKQATTEVVKSEVTRNQINLVAGIMLAIFAIVLVFVVIKYKTFGLYGAISSVGMLAMTVLFIRLAKVIIDITFVPAIIAVIFVHLAITVKLINKIESSENKKGDFWKGIVESLDIILVLAIISIVFIFMYNETIVSCGMILFWGLISTIIATFVFTRTLLLADNNN